ncbi:hypothetical protein AX15_003567 [Amanita polypyramis BW_CC]|nr:hypothetical protein AX15_003567 [Amanita polypyramis BW_CC]
MVVTRRVPVPPAPTTSRTASTQNLHSSRNKSQLSQRVGDNKPSSEDKKALPLPPTKHTSTDTSKKRHSGSILSSFSFLILTLFSLYAVLTLHPSPVESLRNVLSVPNDNLVKPYILPPLRAALSHPVIEPHVTKIQVSFQPYAQRIEIGVRPVLAGVSKIEESHVRPLVRHGTIALYVFIRKSCQQFVIPSYNSYLRPYIQPYVDRWNFFYSHNVEPRLRTSVAECTRHYHKIQPHVNKAWRTARRYSVIVHSVVAPRVDRFYKTTQPHMMTLWVKGRPRMIAGWRCLKVQGIKGLSVLRTYAAVVAVRLGEARRKFVDPHIKRIWEKVESRTAIIDARSSSFSSMSSSTVTTATQDINIENSAIMTPNAPLASETHTTTPLPRLTEATVKSHTSVTKTVINDRTVESPASILSESIGIGVVAEVVLASEVDHDVSMDVPIATYAEVPDSKVPEATPTSQETTAPVVSDREDESVDDFLLQLGVFLTEQPDAQESVSLKHEPLTDHTFSAKQDDDAAAVISAKITAKRIALVNRHNNWQAQLDRLFDSRERDLRISLVTIRKRAVKELKGLLLNGGQESEREHVVESIEQEAGRLVKGIQGYLKKARDGKEKLGNEWYDQLDDKKRQWETVLDKVNEKFAEKVRGVQEEVHTWYLGIRQKEADEASQA